MPDRPHRRGGTVAPIALRAIVRAAFLPPALLLAAATPAAPPISFAAGGDMIGPYASIDGSDPALREVGALFRAADVGYANQEGALFDLDAFAGTAAGESGGGFPVVSPADARVVRALGIGLVSKANNHATDWGHVGLIATLANLRALGFAAAGAGDGEAAARAPAYLATPHGEIALVSTASTFPPMSRADAPVMRGGRSFPRPGISVLRAHEVRLVPPASLAELRRIAGPVAISGAVDTDALRIGDQLFRAGVEGTRWETEADDEAAVLGAIRAARARARLVLFAIHAHETAGHDDDLPPQPFEPLLLHRANEAPSPDDPEPAGFLRALFHKAIDAGADGVLRTGPHSLGGIELYRGRPIFYGLGSLFFSFGGRRSYRAPGGQMKQLPDAWFETVVATTEIGADGACRITLHPATIRSSTGPDDGLPMLAHGARAAAILARLQRLSARYGTMIEIAGDVGVIEGLPVAERGR